MAKFRKRPVVIDAWLIKGSEAPGDLARYVEEGRLRYCEDGSILIKTLEGTMQGFPGDWLIRGVKGELYPCKHDIFKATYEPEDDYDPMADLIQANRDAVLQMHQEAVQFIRRALADERPGRIKEILDALGMFHPMHGESWAGWPEWTKS